MKTFLLFIFSIIITVSCLSQTTPRDISAKFFEIYKQEGSDKALDYLFSNTSYATLITEGIEDTKRQLKKSVGLIGKFHGVDLLTTKTAGPNLTMLTFLVRHDREPLVFNLMFYKPNNKWQMQNFKYGNSIDDELEEASKAYRLQENY